MLQYDGSMLPITALHLLRVPNAFYLLSGEGSSVKLYDLQTSQVLAKERVFQSQAIHGIISRTSGLPQGIQALVLAWGGQSIRLIILRSQETQLDSCNGHPSVTLGDLIIARDWIFDASFCQIEPHTSRPVRAACVTAHNSLLLLDIDPLLLAEKTTCWKLHEAGSSVRSILYSAHVLWLTTDQIVIAAGTVFGEILIWCCYLDPAYDNLEISDLRRTKIVLHNAFTAHEGSVFGVRLLSLPSTGGHLRFALATCSDDRTIRIWDVSQDLGSSRASSLPAVTSTQSTGFNSSQALSLSGRTGNVECVVTAWGHTSRVWGVQFLSFLKEADTKPIRFLSYGEDAVCQQWHISPNLFDSDSSNSTKPQILGPVSTHRSHTGKSIWSLTSIQLDDGSILVATGGADSRISSFTVDDRLISDRTPTQWRAAMRLSEVDSSLKSNQRMFETYLEGDKIYEKLEDLTVSDEQKPPTRKDDNPGEPRESRKGDLSTSKRTPGVKSKSRQDAFNHYSFISRDVLVATTSSGRLLLGKFNAIYPDTEMSSPSQTLWSDRTAFSASIQPEPIQWTEPQDTAQRGSYVTLAGSKELGLAFLAREDGSILTLDLADESFKLLINHSQKAGRIFIQYVQSTGQVMMVVTRLGSNNAGRYTLEKNSQGNITISICGTIQLPPGFLLTSFCLLDHRKLCVLGSRAGDTAIFDASSPGFPESSVIEHPRMVPTNAKVHIDAIVRMLDMKSIGVVDHILRISRDGTISILRSSSSENDEKESSFELLHHAYSGSAARLEGGYFDVQSKDLILYGFRGTEFIVFNETKHIEIMSESCGNGNREWTFEPETGILVYTRDGVMRCSKALGPSSFPIKLGGGGREIKAFATQPSPQGPEDSTIFATGSEDCRVRLFEYGEESCRCLGVYKQHKTGIQHLDWSACGNFLFSSGGLNEFYVWRIRKIANFGIGVVCEAGFDNKSGSDIRITGFSISALALDHNSSCFSEPEFLITIVNSVSDIQVWHYKSRERTFAIRASTKYLASALLTEVAHVIAPRLAVLITAASDGVVAIWELSKHIQENTVTQETTPPYTPELLQLPKTPSTAACLKNGGVKSMLVETISPDQWLVMLGGDDGSLSACILDLETPESPSLVCIASCCGHASAVEAIARIQNTRPQGSDMAFTFATTGADQAIEIRRLILSQQHRRRMFVATGLELLQHIKTDVADTSSLGTLSSRGNAKTGVDEQVLVVAGVGIETFRVLGQ